MTTRRKYWLHFTTVEPLTVQVRVQIRAQTARNFGLVCRGDQPIAWKPPSTWMISAVVAGNQSESSATHAFAAGLGSSTSQPNGARESQDSSKVSNPGTDLAAVVRIGPAAMRLTRTPLGPRSR